MKHSRLQRDREEDIVEHSTKEGTDIFNGRALAASLIDIAAEEQRKHVAKMTARCEDFGTNLLHLFNRHLVDHVRQTGTHTYVPVFSPKLATHQLVGTLWQRDKLRKREIVEHGYALAVVAKPLRPKLRQTQLVLKVPIPDTAPVYRLDGPVVGKRGVLTWIVNAAMHKTRQKGMLRAITKMDEEECDLTYTRLRRASLILKLK